MSGGGGLLPGGVRARPVGWGAPGAERDVELPSGAPGARRDVEAPASAPGAERDVEAASSGPGAGSGGSRAGSRAANGLGLSLSGVRLAYRGREVLHGIDLEVPPGERLAVVGPNGAGKSSLLRCVTGTADGASGSVRLGGLPSGRLTRQQIARFVAVVPQQASVPFATPVEEIVALGRLPYEHPFLGPRPADWEAVARAIDRVGIGDLAGRDAREISLGELQLVLLAMALAQEAPCLVLDEPTVHLDLRHQVATMELLRDLNERDGTTIVAVLHDLALAAHFFPRLVVLDRGRIVADGPPSRALGPAIVRTVFGVDPALIARGSAEGASAEGGNGDGPAADVDPRFTPR